MVSFLKLGAGYILDKKNLAPLNPQDEESIEGKIILITGSNSGLGKATACYMAKKGGKIIIACRDPIKAKEAIDDIRKETDCGELIFHRLDLASLESIRRFAQEIMDSYPHINILINNAGIANTSGEYRKTRDGFESHFGVNHLGHFLLTLLLLGHLKKGSPSRVIFVASSMYLTANLDKKIDDDVMFVKNPCQGIGHGLPYSNSKFANMLCANQFAKKLQGSGINTYVICPGLVNTNVFRDEGRVKHFFTKSLLNIVGFTADKGCETILYCSLSRKCSHESGQMYRFNKIWDLGNKSIEENEILSQKLWKLSEKLLGITTDNYFNF